MTACPLTRTELTVLTHLANGLTYKQIAAKQRRQVSTIRTELHNIYVKTGTTDRAQVVIHAYCEGWLELPISGRSREERLLSRVAVLLDQVSDLIENRRPLGPEQQRYLRLFDRWLQTDTRPASDALRARMIDQLHVLLEEAGIDPTHVPRHNDRQAA
jgi:DNA-binding CsgD family transcriptional regulator